MWTFSRLPHILLLLLLSLSLSSLVHSAPPGNPGFFPGTLLRQVSFGPYASGLGFLFDDNTGRLYLPISSPAAILVLNASDLSTIATLPAANISRQDTWQVQQMAVTSSGDVLWLPDWNTGILWQINAYTGEVVRQLDPSPLLPRPWSLLVRPGNGEVVVGDYGLGRLVAFNADLTVRTVFTSPVAFRAYSIAASSSSPTSPLFVTNSLTNEVWTFSSDLCWTGVLLTDPVVLTPRVLAMAGELLYVSDRSQGRLLVFDSDGQPVASYPDRLSSTQTSLTVDANGYRVFVVLSLPGPYERTQVTVYAGPRSKAAMPICSSAADDAPASAEVREGVEDVSSVPFAHTAMGCDAHCAYLLRRVQQLEAEVARLRIDCPVRVVDEE